MGYRSRQRSIADRKKGSAAAEDRGRRSHSNLSAAEAGPPLQALESSLWCFGVGPGGHTGDGYKATMTSGWGTRAASRCVRRGLQRASNASRKQTIVSKSSDGDCVMCVPLSYFTQLSWPKLLFLHSCGSLGQVRLAGVGICRGEPLSQVTPKWSGPNGLVSSRCKTS